MIEIETALVEDWFRLHRHKNPMNPKDPGDRCVGWTYAIHSHWRQSKEALTESELQRGKAPKEDMRVLTYESTLLDAQLTLSMQADRVEGFMMRQSSKNRFYGSDGEQMLTLTVIQIEDNDPEFIQ